MRIITQKIITVEALFQRRSEMNGHAMKLGRVIFFMNLTFPE